MGTIHENSANENPPPAAGAPLPSSEAADRLARSYRQVGDRWNSQGRYPEAISAYRQALRFQPDCAETAISLADCASRQGHNDEAIELYRHAAALGAQDARVHFMCGDALLGVGSYKEAMVFFRRAIELNPEYAQARCGLGLALHETGEYALAVQESRTAIKLDPTYMWPYNNAGNSLRALGQLDASLEMFQEALRLDPKCALAHNNYGLTLKALGRGAEAIESYRSALQIDPQLTIAHYNLGSALRAQGKQDEAIGPLRKTVEMNPRNGDAFLELGQALKDKRNFSEAAEALRSAIRLKRTSATAQLQLGLCLKELGQNEPAVEAFREAARLDPASAEALNHCAITLNVLGRNSEAVECAREAVRINPQYAWAYNVLGFVLQGNSELEAAREAYRKAVELSPTYTIAHDNYVYCHLFQPQATLASVKADHIAWSSQHADKFKSHWGGWQVEYDPERLPVLGFVSPDFRRHPVGEFLVRTIEELGKQGWRTLCYANQVVNEQDHLTKRFKAAASVWREVRDMSDDALEKQIRQDRVDILFDTTGHLANNRLLLFARGPAPIQITWLGYMATLGMEAVDYIIGDQYQTPVGCEHGYTEKIIRMPHSFLCYDPPPYAPAVAPSPFEKKGYTTFGCYNVVSKMGPATVAAWSNILKRVFMSRMVFKAKEFNDTRLRQRFLEMFAANDIEAERIEFIGGTSHQAHLGAYEHIDIQLDPFPFTGSTTTLESLHMGVPVVTLTGETFPARHSSSYLSVVGLNDLVADNVDAYVEKAVNLANDPERLSTIRKTLRESMQKSPLCDQQLFVADLARELRGIWRERCAQMKALEAARLQKSKSK